MHTHIDLYCAPGNFVEVTLDESLRTTEARERIERYLLDRREGRIMPNTTGFCYFPPNERWSERRMTSRLHEAMKYLFGEDHTVSYYLNDRHVTREADGTEYFTE